MFNKIWKGQIVKPKGKLGIWKPKEELRPREEEDRDCCEEAKKMWIELGEKDFGWAVDKGEDSLVEWYTEMSCDMFKRRLNDFKNRQVGQMSPFGNPWTTGFVYPEKNDAIEVLKFWKECEDNV